MTAKEARQITIDSAAIKNFQEKLDDEIFNAARSGYFFTICYLDWDVSDAAVESIAEGYRKAGYTVDYTDRETGTARGDNSRRFRVNWKEAE